MRILSLIPSATEIVYALGLGDDLVGVTAECDTPPEVRLKPSVSAPVVSADSPHGIDAAVRDAVAEGRPLYDLDLELVRELRPDLILAQDICRVCAVPSGDVAAALDRLGTEADVLSLDPRDFGGVLESIADVAARVGVTAAGARVVADLLGRVEAVRALIEPEAESAPRTVCLEWPDPLFAAGNWVPEMVDLAGGLPMIGDSGAPSRETNWDEIVGVKPDVIVHMPCGYPLQQSVARSSGLLRALETTETAGDCQLWAVDAMAFFSRPGPRIVDGVEILAHMMHPRAVPPPPAGRSRRLR